MPRMPKPHEPAICRDCGRTSNCGENAENVCLFCGGALDLFNDLAVRLPDSQLMAFAQLLKRIGHAEIRALARDDRECYEIKDAISVFQRELANIHFNPR